YTPAMQYRSFPRMPGLRASVLGLGAMRLPVVGGVEGSIDGPALDGILRAAREAGINYLDTAYVYHDGHSEEAVGRALDRTGLRGEFLLATKSPVWLVKPENDWDRLLEEQLERLGTDRIDFYLLHALNAPRWRRVERQNGIRFLERAKADGRIGHAGFSFHDSAALFRTIVDAWEGWDFCQVQYNYLDTDFQAGLDGIRYAASRNLGVVVMEPMRGGSLAALPPEARAVFSRWPRPRMPAEWALRYALEPQEVTVVLSGMGSETQVWENAAVADAARPNSLTLRELALYSEVRDFFRERMPVPCTTCGYCMPCPHKVLIPDVFDMYNTASLFLDRLENRKSFYRSAYRNHGNGGDSCVSCGECVPKCPQGIAIPERLAAADAFLA
ncbi:MAG TPA: aldo/keto reductase, partial [Magnetospirillaceae bacterium]|nr:aldo/keto reductase [Magnetospirillaceae bacterium]